MILHSEASTIEKTSTSCSAFVSAEMSHLLGESDTDSKALEPKRPPVVSVPYQHTSPGVDPKRIVLYAPIPKAPILYEKPPYHMDPRRDYTTPAAPPTASILFAPSPYQYQATGVDPKKIGPPTAPILYKKILSH